MDEDLEYPIETFTHSERSFCYELVADVFLLVVIAVYIALVGIALGTLLSYFPFLLGFTIGFLAAFYLTTWMRTSYGL